MSKVPYWFIRVPCYDTKNDVYLNLEDIVSFLTCTGSNNGSWSDSLTKVKLRDGTYWKIGMHVDDFAQLIFDAQSRVIEEANGL